MLQDFSYRKGMLSVVMMRLLLPSTRENIEMVEWYKDKVEIVKKAHEKGSKNCQMLSPNIQKDLTKACAEEVMAIIMDEIRGRKFSALIDESRDVSIKEQMAVILRLVIDTCIFLPRFVPLFLQLY
jgi:hypothetical protein